MSDFECSKTSPRSDSGDAWNLLGVPFPLLADPERYQPDTIDLVRDTAALHLWLDIFDSHLKRLHKLAIESDARPDAAARADAMALQFASFLADYRTNPLAHGPASVRRFCTMREELLRLHDFADPYKAIKDQENLDALKLLPDVLAELDQLAPALRLQRIIEGVFAGNIFDLGCAGTTELFESGRIGFRQTRDSLPARPWCVDDLDALTRRMAGPAHRKAIVFVDNAGADVVLGMMPLTRYLLQRGTQVVLTANTTPALNDILIHELHELLNAVATLDETIASAWAGGSLRVLPSGNSIPLIDLRCVDRRLAAEAADADLLILEGMGRSLETNFHARFTIDTLKLAMIKEQHVAETIGGRLYGVVCRFEPRA